MVGMLDKAPLSPIVTGSALLLLLKGPESIRKPALDYLHQFLSPENVGRLITSLKWLFAFGLVRNATTLLNTWAGNNFSWRSQKRNWIWEKEIALVTGGSSGFGALFARDLSAKGIHVVVLDINPLPPHLESNPKVSFFKCDVTDPDAVKDVAQTVQSSVGHPSILINNAGISDAKAIVDTSPAFLQKLFSVNVLSHYYMVQAFLPNMIAQKKGQIIALASMASFFTAATIVDYSMSKAAVLAFHEGLSVELRTVHKCPEIRTTVVHPFFADTPMIAKGKEELQRLGVAILNPQDISDAVVDQIMNVRGGQIVISGRLGGVIRAFRGFPFWLQEAFKRVSESDASHVLKQ